MANVLERENLFKKFLKFRGTFSRKIKLVSENSRGREKRKISIIEPDGMEEKFFDPRDLFLVPHSVHVIWMIL